MPDISMCLNGCDKKLKCYRFMATPNIRQSFADFKPDEKGECKHFYEIE